MLTLEEIKEYFVKNAPCKTVIENNSVNVGDKFSILLSDDVVSINMHIEFDSYKCSEIAHIANSTQMSSKCTKVMYDDNKTIVLSTEFICDSIIMFEFLVMKYNNKFMEALNYLDNITEEVYNEKRLNIAIKKMNSNPKSN